MSYTTDFILLAWYCLYGHPGGGEEAEADVGGRIKEGRRKRLEKRQKTWIFSRWQKSELQSVTVAVQSRKMHQFLHDVALMHHPTNTPSKANHAMA